MRMAVTYDAAFLDRAGLRGLRADPERAAFWYRRARELGEGKAQLPFSSLGTLRFCRAAAPAPLIRASGGRTRPKL